MRFRILRVMPVVVLVACGSPGSSPAAAPTVDAALLAGPSEPRSVDAAMLVEEASDARLAEVLEDAGFEDANERTWTDRRAEIWRTVVRALRFDSAEGAERYLAWLEANAGSLIGSATRAGTGEALAFEHEASDCCPNKDGPRALAAAARGDLVWTVMLTGPAADATAAVALLPADLT